MSPVQSAVLKVSKAYAASQHSLHVNITYSSDYEDSQVHDYKAAARPASFFICADLGEGGESWGPRTRDAQLAPSRQRLWMSSALPGTEAGLSDAMWNASADWLPSGLTLEAFPRLQLPASKPIHTVHGRQERRMCVLSGRPSGWSCLNFTPPGRCHPALLCLPLLHQEPHCGAPPTLCSAGFRSHCRLLSIRL